MYSKNIFLKNKINIIKFYLHKIINLLVFLLNIYFKINIYCVFIVYY